MKASTRWIVVCLAFLWLAFVYASFYLVHEQRPVDNANVQAISSTLLNLLTAAAIWVVGAGLGRRVCHWLKIPLDGIGESLVLGSGVGLGVLAVLMLGIGLSGGLRRWVAMLLLGGLALLLLPDLLALVRTSRDLRLVTRLSWGMRAYLIGTLILTLVLALAPPMDWDGLFYHLKMPQLYMEQGRIAPMTDMPHQYFPGMMEMLYLLGMLVKGDVAAKLLHFVYMLLLAGAVYLLAERHIGSGHGWPAVTVYAAMPMVSVLGGWAYNDLALAFYQMAALYALLNWFRGNKWPWLGLAAAFCGLAMGLKYTSFVCPLTMALFIVWRLARDRAPWRTWLHALGLFGGVSLLVGAPWYLRNLVFTGNPVYPFAYSLFGGAGWDEWRAAWYARSGTGLSWDPGKLLALPWTLTLGVRDMNFFDGRTGPLFLLALPFLIAWGVRLWRRPGSRPPAMAWLSVFALTQYIFWVAGVIASRSLFQSRLLLTGLVALCGPLAYLFQDLGFLDLPALSLRRLIGMTVVLVLAGNFCYQLLEVVHIAPVGVLVGEETQEAFLRRNLGAHYAAMELVNERVPENGRVLFLWEPRSYYCRRAVQPDPILERWAWTLHQYKGDITVIHQAFVRDGYTHVLLHRAGLENVIDAQRDPITDADLAAWDAFVETYLREEERIGDAYILYRLAAN